MSLALNVLDEVGVVLRCASYRFFTDLAVVLASTNFHGARVPPSIGRVYALGDDHVAGLNPQRRLHVRRELQRVALRSEAVGLRAGELRLPTPTELCILATGPTSMVNVQCTLRVDGKVSLSRSGVATISKGHSGCTGTVASGLDPTPRIFATLQGSAGGGVYLRYAKRASATTFSIKLNKAATTTVSIAWFIIG
jgi:hypothetical protein